MEPERLAWYEEENPDIAESIILARFVAEHGVRNTELENLHAGRWPGDGRGSTKKTAVVCGKDHIPWNEVSRFSDREMRVLMMDIEKHLAATLWQIRQWEKEGKLPEMLEQMKQSYFGEHGISWDIPEQKWQQMKAEHRALLAERRARKQAEKL